MKSFYCKRLYEDINFDAENIYVCCGKKLGPSFPIPSSETDLNNYCKLLTDWKYNCVKNAFLGEISDECKNCIELKEKDIPYSTYVKAKFFPSFLKKDITKEFKIKNIVVKSFRQCELSCLYCLERHYTKGEKTTNITKSQFYDFLPILKSFEKQDLLNKDNLEIEFQGGSITVWDEFLPVLNEAVNFGVKKLMYHTNAVTFVKEIADYSQNISSSMSIAIDSGSSETYKKIKGGDKFNQVLENIIKYANANIACSVKYIIVRNLNDTVEELAKFLSVIKELRNKTNIKENILPMLDIDFKESLSSCDYNIPANYLDMIKFAAKFCKENNIEIGMQEFIKNKVEKEIF